MDGGVIHSKREKKCFCDFYEHILYLESYSGYMAYGLSHPTLYLR